ncbi:uncharacterized protein BKA55DRAFT_685090 [Fusarium redolens]|uniref:Uncharacterized protein n=1 Tax=Fusarium redolens TaxID=48865 RepID=A0A9P9KSP1_FUSRE|nr:uncharacterized protein BKA55DRAFT_685090 [Fusarium redolens]KAH7267806.1 hypothetical protein BKA55DRAFT_685090 [Fusarium redolens]
MPLIMGLTLHPPKPALAGDMINKFNVTSDHMDNVYLPGDMERWPLFLDMEKSHDPAWQPQGSSKTMPWEDLCDKWRKIADKRLVAAVNLWAKRLPFDQESFDKDRKGEEKKPKFNPLRRQMPRALLDRYETMIPALPSVAVGV